MSVLFCCLNRLHTPEVRGKLRMKQGPPMLNQQKPEPQARHRGLQLDLHSMFYTIQGEGPFTGERALFIRLAGCNLQCPWCDTEYTEGRRMIGIMELADKAAREIVARTAKRGDHLIVITGGEPFRQPIGKFIGTLVDMGFRVQVESNGVLAPDDDAAHLFRYSGRAFLVCSPKTSRIHASMHELAFAFKYVLHHENIDLYDHLPIKALGHKASPYVARPDRKIFSGPIFVNPEDSKDPQVNAANLAAVKESCMAHGYIAGVQLHKLLDIA